MELTNEEKENFNKQFYDLINSDEMVYFYHVTESNSEEVVFNEGLVMREQNLATKMIPIDEEILENPLAFVLDEANRGFNRTVGSVILIGILKEDLPYAIKINKNAINVADCEYVLESEYIIASIDIESLKITLNESYMLAPDIEFMSNMNLY